jgi:hypothetical protein
MALCYIQVGRVVPGGYHSFGHFVIDVPYTTQDEILAVLSDNDKSKIGFHLGVTPAWENLPTDIQFHLRPMAVNPMDLPPTITFTSEAGYKIWVTQQDQTLKL